MSLEIVIVCIVFLLILQAFFAGSEIALISCDKIKMRYLADNGSRSARLVLSAYKDVDKFLGTSLVGINLALIINTLILTFYIEKNYGISSEFYTVLILSPLIVIFGQVVPKAVFQNKRNSVILWAIYPLWAASRIFYPILIIVRLFTKLIMKLIGRDQNSSITRDELLDVLEGDKEKPVTDFHTRILKRIFGFSETTVDEIMIPLVNIDALDRNSNVDDAIKLIKKTGHTRIPVYDERIDNITAVLHSFYLLGDISPDDPISKYALKPFYVPESKLVNELLDEMKEGRTGMAIVVDEYGGAVGAITLEDILEEVVGEIEDEYDKGTRLWRKTGEKSYLINPKIEIEQINDDIGLGIPEGEDYDTLGGFLLYKYGSFPGVGEKIVFSNKTFEITRSTNRSIDEVKLKIK